MHNVQQIGKGEGKGRHRSCICGRSGTAEVQLQPVLNFDARRGGCSALSSGRFFPRKVQVYILQEAGWTGMDKSPNPGGIQSPAYSVQSVNMYNIKMKLILCFVKHN